MREGVSFVGLYASFPIERDQRRVNIIKTVLNLETNHDFKRIKSGSLMGKLNTFSFTEERLQSVLRRIESGEDDYLQLFPYNVGDDWIQSYSTSVGMDWDSAVVQPYKRSLSPIETRFGNAGYIKVQYPMSRFSIDQESDFQKKILDVVKRLHVREKMHWAFVHRGFHFAAPASIGTDDLFRDTRKGYPLTSFDADLGIGVFFKEFAKGAFWANFLNPFHLKALGGSEQLMREKPCKFIEELGEGRVLLQVEPSPLTADESKAITDYQRLRHFLRPILIETSEDRTRIQREVLGTWRPPESAKQNFEEYLTEIDKKSH